jgi:type IV secretion system protein VirB9
MMQLIKPCCRWFVVTVVVLLSGMSISFAAKAPKSLSTDYRIKQIMYDPNQIFNLVGVYGYQTAIEFAQDETVKVVTLGDSIAWQTVPYHHRLFIKPVEAMAQTNMTVITDKHTYYFKLDSTHNKASMTFLVRFQYPGRHIVEHDANSAGFAGLDKIDLDYGVSGDRQSIKLKRAFDDGQFTYFQFENDTDIPALYVVSDDGTEAIVNTRREGQYLVAERLSERFTLRNGKAYLCVKKHVATSVDTYHEGVYAN